MTNIEAYLKTHSDLTGLWFSETVEVETGIRTGQCTDMDSSRVLFFYPVHERHSFWMDSLNAFLGWAGEKHE